MAGVSLTHLPAVEILFLLLHCLVQYQFSFVLSHCVLFCPVCCRLLEACSFLKKTQWEVDLGEKVVWVSWEE